MTDLELMKAVQKRTDELKEMIDNLEAIFNVTKKYCIFLIDYKDTLVSNNAELSLEELSKRRLEELNSIQKSLALHLRTFDRFNITTIDKNKIIDAAYRLRCKWLNKAVTNQELEKFIALVGAYLKDEEK